MSARVWPARFSTLAAGDAAASEAPAVLDDSREERLADLLRECEPHLATAARHCWVLDAVTKIHELQERVAAELGGG